MSVLLIYASFAMWFAALVISAYATYRLYKYGPYNANLVWDLTRRVTDFTTCVAFGVGAALLTFKFNHGVDNWVLMPLAFAAGFILARVIWSLSLYLVSSSYNKRQQERTQYVRAMMEAECKLRKEGLYPSHNLFSEDPQAENKRFSRALDELRAQGKLPAVPKWMLKNN